MCKTEEWETSIYWRFYNVGTSDHLTCGIPATILTNVGSDLILQDEGGRLWKFWDGIENGGRFHAEAADFNPYVDQPHGLPLFVRQAINLHDPLYLDKWS